MGNFFKPKSPGHEKVGVVKGSWLAAMVCGDMMLVGRILF